MLKVVIKDKCTQ